MTRSNLLVPLLAACFSALAVACIDSPYVDPMLDSGVKMNPPDSGNDPVFDAGMMHVDTGIENENPPTDGGVPQDAEVDAGPDAGGPRDGGNPLFVAQAGPAPDLLITDGQNIFWSNANSIQGCAMGTETC